MFNLEIPLKVNCTGIVRSIDNVGRICLPVEWRNYCGIHKGDEVEMIMTDKGILLTRCDAQKQESKQ